MLDKVMALIGACVLSLSVHADIYHFNGIITSVTGPVGLPPDNPYNTGDQFNFTIKVDLQSPGYRIANGGTALDFLASTESYTYYAAEYISGDAVENVTNDNWNNHFYIEYNSGGSGSGDISVLNNLNVNAPGVPSIDLWDTDTNIIFYQIWREGFVIRSIQGQITSFTVDNDSDSDGVDDSFDNCTLEANIDQRDSNGDGFGNACDPDIDNNGVVNFADISAWVPLFNTACGDVDEDFDGSGTCNFGDFALFPAYFLQPPGPSGVAP